MQDRVLALLLAAILVAAPSAAFAGTETITVDTPTTPAAPAHLHGPARLFAIDGEVAS